MPSTAEAATLPDTTEIPCNAQLSAAPSSTAPSSLILAHLPPPHRHDSIAQLCLHHRLAACYLLPDTHPPRNPGSHYVGVEYVVSAVSTCLATPPPRREGLPLPAMYRPAVQSAISALRPPPSLPPPRPRLFCATPRFARSNSHPSIPSQAAPIGKRATVTVISPPTAVSSSPGSDSRTGCRRPASSSPATCPQSHCYVSGSPPRSSVLCRLAPSSRRPTATASMATADDQV